MNNLDKLKHKYGEELMAAIIGGFKGYDMHFNWGAAWLGYGEPQDSDPVLINKATPDDPNSILLGLIASDDTIYPQLEESDFEVFKKFVTEITLGFIRNHEGKEPYENLNLILDVVDVWRSYYEPNYCVKFYIVLNDKDMC